MTCALCVVFTHGIIPPALAGLALSYATSVSIPDNDMCTVCVVFTHGIIPPALAGLALSYATSVSVHQ